MGKFNKGMTSSKDNGWETPQGFFDMLNEKYHFTLDAAASDENHKCDRYFTKYDDALKKEWTGVVFCNPPYGKGIGRWVQKGYEESLAGATVVMLLPARTDTAWFHDYCVMGKVSFIRGRLKFSGASINAPFPSMIVVFGEKPDGFIARCM